MTVIAGACPSKDALVAMLWLARSNPVPANASAARGLWLVDSSKMTMMIS